MGTMTWIYTDYPEAKPPLPPTTPFGRCKRQSPERRWDAPGGFMASLRARILTDNPSADRSSGCGTTRGHGPASAVRA